MYKREEVYRFLQFFIRYSLQKKFSERWIWPKMPKIRELLATDETFVTHFDGNTRILTNLSDHIESQIYWQGVQEGDRGEMKLLDKILRPEHTFFDVGANVGVFSLFSSKRVHRGHIHAFEPYDQHLSRFKSNLNLNKIENIKVNDFGLSNKQAHCSLYVPRTRNTGMASMYKLLDEGMRPLEFEARFDTLDNYAFRNSIDKLDIIKIDVEGAEMDVLEGGAGVIRTLRPAVMMEVDRDHLTRAGREVDSVIHFWEQNDYRLFRINHDGSLDHVYEASQLEVHQNIYCRPL